MTQAMLIPMAGWEECVLWRVWLVLWIWSFAVRIQGPDAQ